MTSLLTCLYGLFLVKLYSFTKIARTKFGCDPLMVRNELPSFVRFMKASMKTSIWSEFYGDNTCFPIQCAVSKGSAKSGQLERLLIYTYIAHHITVM